LPQDRLEGSLRAVEFLSISELNYGAIVAQPLEQPGGIFNGHATGWKLPNLCTQVEDDADSSLGAEVGGCEILGGAKTRRIPLDAFVNGRVDAEHQLAQRLNFSLVWMNKCGHEGIDRCR